MLLQIIASKADTVAQAAIHEESGSIPRWLDNNLTSALIGVIFSFILFYFAIFRERNKDKQDEKEIRQKRLSYLAILLKSIVEYSNHQNKNLATAIEKIKINPYDFPLMTFAPKSDLERAANKLNQEDYFHAYLTHYGKDKGVVKEFQLIFASIDYLNLQFDQLLEMIKISAQYDHSRKLEFSRLLGEATKLSATCCVSVELSGRADFISFLSGHLEQFITRRTDDTDIKFAFENFVDPIKMGIADGFIDIPVAVSIANLLQSASTVYSDIPRQTQAVKEDFDGIHTSIIESTQKLQVIMDTLLTEFWQPTSA